MRAHNGWIGLRSFPSIISSDHNSCLVICCHLKHHWFDILHLILVVQSISVNVTGPSVQVNNLGHAGVLKVILPHVERQKLFRGVKNVTQDQVVSLPPMNIPHDKIKRFVSCRGAINTTEVSLTTVYVLFVSEHV